MRNVLSSLKVNILALKYGGFGQDRTELRTYFWKKLWIENWLKNLLIESWAEYSW